MVDAYELALADAGLSNVENVLDQIRTLLDQTKGAGSAFVRQSLSGRMWQFSEGW